MTKWTAERRAKYKRTIKAKALAKAMNGGNGAKTHSLVESFPPELDRALEAHYRKKILEDLLRGLGET